MKEEQLLAQCQAAANAEAKAKSSARASSSANPPPDPVPDAPPDGGATVSQETRDVMSNIRAKFTEPLVNQFIDHIREIFGRPYLTSIDPTTNDERDRALISARDALRYLDDRVREENTRRNTEQEAKPPGMDPLRCS